VWDINSNGSDAGGKVKWYNNLNFNVQEYGLSELMTTSEFKTGITIFLVVGHPAAPIST
jgi:hypothetical protein